MVFSRIACACVAAVSLLVVVAQLHGDEPDERPKWAQASGELLFKGRLVGVTFVRTYKQEDKRRYLRLQFSLSETYAGPGVTGTSEFDSYEIMTEWPAELDGITEPNYVRSVEAMFQAPIHLGQECLVKATAGSAAYRDLESIEPATEDATDEFLRKHHELILKSKRGHTVALFYAWKIRTNLIKNNMLEARQRASTDNDDFDWIKFQREVAAKYEEEFETDCDALITAIDAATAKLRNDEQASTDELERKYIRWTILDLEDVRAEVEVTRNQRTE